VEVEVAGVVCLMTHNYYLLLAIATAKSCKIEVMFSTSFYTQYYWKKFSANGEVLSTFRSCQAGKTALKPPATMVEDSKRSRLGYEKKSS
jgi:hypothetical protein